MRHTDKKNRLQADSIPEVIHKFGLAVLDLARVARFRGRKLAPAHLLNAIVLHFSELPKEEREAIGVKSLARFEAAMGSDPDLGESLDMANVTASRKNRRQRPETDGGKKHG
jgi:hypothetical protein